MMGAIAMAPARAGRDGHERHGPRAGRDMTAATAPGRAAT